MLELTPLSQSPGTYRYFVTLAAPAQAVPSCSPRDKHNYTQANRSKTEVIVWTRFCQAEKTKCAHMDRKWHLRDKNLLCVSSAGKKTQKTKTQQKNPSPWLKQAQDFQFCLKVAFQFVYLSLADILL